MASFASSATTCGARKHAWTNIESWFPSFHQSILTLSPRGNWSRRACVRHTGWRTKRSWPLFSPTFFFFLLSFFYAFYFSSTSRNLPFVKILQVSFFFPRKKGYFRVIFRDGQCSVAEPGPTPSPWSISLLLSFFYAFYFSPTSGNLPCMKICFPQYFGITRRYMQKRNIFQVIFLFLRKNPP